MGAKNKTSEHQKKLYKAYANEGRSLKNRTVKLQRHIKKFPMDLQAKKALKDGLVVYRRQKSRHKVWNKENKELAHLLRTLGLKGSLVLKWAQDKVKQNMTQ